MKIENDALRLRVERLEGFIKKAVGRLGAPTMDYEPEIAIREYQDSIEEATRVLLKAIQRR